MTHVTHKKREHDKEKNETVEAYFQLLGGAACATQNVQSLQRANNFFNLKNND